MNRTENVELTTLCLIHSENQLEFVEVQNIAKTDNNSR